MKQIFKWSTALFLSLILICSTLIVSAAATTSISFSNNKPKVGDTVTVTVKLNAGESIYSVDGSLTYNSSVLQYVSGASNASGSTLRFVDSFGGETSTSYSVVFKTISEGASSMSFSMQYVGASLTKVSASGASATLNVKNPAPVSSKPYVKSNNANLSSLTVSGTAISPAFDRNVTEYTATVENSVTMVNIGVSKSNNRAKIEGNGDVSLNIGDNVFTITVTAEDGTKKVYTVKIRRLTVEETIASNPLAAVVGGQMHHIVPELAEVPAPVGFTIANSTYNGKEINVFQNEDSSYMLYYLRNDETGAVDYYVYKAHRDEFVKLNYITVSGTMYILSDLPENYVMPDGYYETAATIGENTVKAFCSNDKSLSDFYVVYCFANGTYGFYRFDTLQTTIQRAPEFSPAVSGADDGSNKFDLIALFISFSKLERILVCSLAAAVIIIIALIIVLIYSRRRYQKTAYNAPITDDDMIDFFAATSQNNSFVINGEDTDGEHTKTLLDGESMEEISE